MNSLPNESPIEIEARSLLAEFNAKLYESFTERMKGHPELLNTSTIVWIPETLHILGITLGWEPVKNLCIHWQDKLDVLFENVLKESGNFTSYDGSMGWRGNMRGNEEIIARILDFSKFGIDTELLREEVKKRTEILLREFTP